MSNISSSYELDSFITQQLCCCYDLDSHVPDFFSLIQTESPKEDEITKIPYCSNPDAYACIKSDTNKFYPYVPKEQITFSKFEYPQDVKDFIEDFEPHSLIFLGYFPLANFFYCIVDNVLILFDTKKAFSKIESDNTITACDIALPDKFVYETEKVGFLLIYSTESTITALPIGKTCDKLYDSAKVTIQTSFTPTTIKAYSKEFSSDIFIGSNIGHVFGLFYKFNQDKMKIDLKIKNLTSIDFKNWKKFINSVYRRYFKLCHPIEYVCFERATGFLAAVDTSSNIFFYKYDSKKQKLIEVSIYEPLKGVSKKDEKGNKEGDEQDINYKERIISINEVSISDSEYTRFVCITDSGERLFFGTSPGEFLNDEIHILQKTYAPREIVGNRLISGGFFLNNSMFVCDRYVISFHPYYHPHRPNINPTEFYEVFDFEDSQPINIVIPCHEYQNQTFRLFYHELMYEHIREPAFCYLMCAQCYYKLTFTRPVDVLKDLITESKGHFSYSIREWMTYYGENAESAATLLLLASENIEKKIEDRWTLTILSQYSSMKMNQAHPLASIQNSSIFNANDINNLYPTCAGFIQRAAKLLSVVWQTPVLTKDLNDHYCLSPIFTKLPPNLNDQLQNLIELTKIYMNIKRSLNTNVTKSAFQRKEEADELAFFEKLREYLQKIIEILKFIHIVSEQNALINEAIPILKQMVFERLSKDSFGSENQQISLYEALREFASSLLTKDLSIYQLFAKECPNFLSVEDRKIIDITNRLEKHSPGAQKSLLDEAREIYIKYIKQPFKLNRIVELFDQNKYTKGIIDVCLHKADACDPEGIALKWYNGDRSILDLSRRYYFDLRYECYKFIFKLIEDNSEDNSKGSHPINHDNVDQMLTSNDKLFHVCLYHKMLCTDHIEDLLSFSSPFIESFLMEYAPDHRWIYCSRQNNYGKSAHLLFEMIENKDKNFTLKQRTKWLCYVHQLASADNDTELKNEAKLKYMLAGIQLKLNERMKKGEIPSTNKNSAQYLLMAQDLFNTCCENFQWDLVLNIIAFSPISGENKITIISKVWSNYFQQQLWNVNLAVATQQIVETCKFNELVKESEVCNPSITLPVFEEHRLRKEGSELWAVDTMLSANFDKHLVLKAYLDALDNQDLSQNVRLDFSYAVAYLIAKKEAYPREKSLFEIKEYFTSKGTKCSYYDEAVQYMKSF